MHIMMVVTETNAVMEQNSQATDNDVSDYVNADLSQIAEIDCFIILSFIL